jgi:hypothetical protein
MNGRSFISGRGRDFCLPHQIQTGPGTHASYYPTGTGALSPGVKWLGREADQSPPSSAEVKKTGAVPTFPLRVHGMVLNELNTRTTLPLP